MKIILIAAALAAVSTAASAQTLGMCGQNRCSRVVIDSSGVAHFYRTPDLVNRTYQLQGSTIRPVEKRNGAIYAHFPDRCYKFMQGVKTYDATTYGLVCD
jgi:hypothetical protein